ncbi:hypothetical protein ACFFX0_24655 [Citricoccus parietis]|uniref:Uncharacterized protein n=1 Tax=Citricoccus parietis TaxID=592307 RepID=A0ABV5G5M7_9MICC
MPAPCPSRCTWGTWWRWTSSRRRRRTGPASACSWPTGWVASSRGPCGADSAGGARWNGSSQPSPARWPGRNPDALRP